MCCSLSQVAGVILLDRFLHSLKTRHPAAIPEVGSATARQASEAQAAISVSLGTGLLAQRGVNLVLAL